MYTKNVEVKVDWLDDLDGKTVAQAIEYLTNLDKALVLNAWLDGDTHGCDMKSNLTRTVPMTNAEIYFDISSNLSRQIKTYEVAKAGHVAKGQVDRVANCDRLLAPLREKLEAARVKYAETPSGDSTDAQVP